MVAGIHSSTARASTWEIHLGFSWRFMGFLPCFQVVECTIYVAYNLDYPFHYAAIQEHYAGHHHTLDNQYPIDYYLDDKPSCKLNLGWGLGLKFIAYIIFFVYYFKFFHYI